MSYLRDTEEHTYSPDRVWSGTIATTAQSMSDTVSVVLPGLVGDIRWDDCRWAPKDNITLPQMGDECVVVMDDTGQICVVDWGDMPYVVNGKIPMGQPDGTVDWVDPPTSGGEPGPQGPKGDKGDKGDTGNTGPQGVQGVKGDKGDTGNTGAQGIQGNTGATGPGVPAGGATGTALVKTSPADYATAWQVPATGSQITYTGVYDPAHTYHDGDYTVGPDGITYQCVKEGTVGVTPTPWSVYPNTAYATTLPAAPFDGQEAVLVDSVINPTYQWRFRYNAGSTSAYKWEFIGGPTIESRVDAFETLNPSDTAMHDLTTVGPTFTPVRSGEYIAQWGGIAVIYNTTTIATYMNFAGGAGGAATLQAGSTTANTQSNVTTRSRVTMTAATLYKCQYGASATGASFSWNARWLSIIPVRVS